MNIDFYNQMFIYTCNLIMWDSVLCIYIYMQCYGFWVFWLSGDAFGNYIFGAKFGDYATSLAKYLAGIILSRVFQTWTLSKHEWAYK